MLYAEDVGGPGQAPTLSSVHPHISYGDRSSLGRYVFGSEISYNKAPPRLPGLGC